jgi:hypothetical protein
MVAVPVAWAVASPDELTILSTVALLLDQVPPPEPSVNVVVAPTHEVVAPVIALGFGYTVTPTVL